MRTLAVANQKGGSGKTMSHGADDFRALAREVIRQERSVLRA